MTALVFAGHPGLRAVAEPVCPLEFPGLGTLVVNLRAALAGSPNGVAIAAPQIGVGKRLVALHDHLAEGLDLPLSVLVNPRLTFAADRGPDEPDWEGCLSVPGYQALVPRPSKVTLDATRLDGRPIHLEAEGFLARVLQHEVDHLDGVLYTDRMVPRSLVCLAGMVDAGTDPS
jgi:peptide deformylase